MSKKFQILLPVHNEGLSIKKTLMDIYEALKNEIDFEFIITEDGSTDDTKEILNNLKNELPMTLILRPFNFNTLPVHLYELAEAENLSSIGVPGLILIIICLIPVIILSKGIIKNVRH